MGMEGVYADYDLDWPSGLAGGKVSDGDVIDLGGIQVQILATPGHSSCSISAYVSQLRALFPSDGGGVPFKNTIIPAANSNFTQYLESLTKLQPLPVDYLCADHYGYVSGDEAHDYLARSLKLAEQEFSRLKGIYLRTGDIEAAVQELASAFLDTNPDYLLTREIYEGICRQQMRHISRLTDGSL
jgi:glyoxylase-like metal-dependent hydrolase (beta-lactamase superfamily II)